MTAVYIDVAMAQAIERAQQAKVVVVEGDPTPIAPIFQAFGAHYHRKMKCWHLSMLKLDKLIRALESRGVAVEVKRW